MSTIGHSSHVAALRYQHSTAQRSQASADYLDGVISAARLPQMQNDGARPQTAGSACMGVAWSQLTGVSRREQTRVSPGTTTKRRRAESNRRTGLCRPLPKPLGHAAAPRSI